MTFTPEENERIERMRAESYGPCILRPAFAPKANDSGHRGTSDDPDLQSVQVQRDFADTPIGPIQRFDHDALFRSVLNTTPVDFTTTIVKKPGE